MPRAYSLSNSRQPALEAMDYEPRPFHYGLPPPPGSHGSTMTQPWGRLSYPPAGHQMSPGPVYPEWNYPMPQEPFWHDAGPLDPSGSLEYTLGRRSRRAPDNARENPRYFPQMRITNRDEFDGPHQTLNRSSARNVPARDEELPQLPTNLDAAEQDRILHQVNDRLSQCAYDFFAAYQFPIPLEQDKRPVQVPSDREWNEWVHLLKRLATRRRIPRHALHNGQIKQLITVLENSLEMRHAAKHSSRPVKDDRNVLQLISAGTQVTKILKDTGAMSFFDRLYVDTEKLIHERCRRVRFADA